MLVPLRAVSQGMGRQTAPTDAEIFNPAFDVTPAELVTALITEKGVVEPPFGIVRPDALTVLYVAAFTVAL